MAKMTPAQLQAAEEAAVARAKAKTATLGSGYAQAFKDFFGGGKAVADWFAQPRTLLPVSTMGMESGKAPPPPQSKPYVPPPWRPAPDPPTLVNVPFDPQTWTYTQPQQQPAAVQPPPPVATDIGAYSRLPLAQTGPRPMVDPDLSAPVMENQPPTPYQREWARMQAEEAVKRSGQEVAANVQDALKTGRPGELGANFRPIWDAQQGINTARQYGDAREGSLYGARPSPQNAPILSGAYEGMAPSAFRTGPLVGTERRYGDAPLQPVRTDEMIQQEQTAALNARMGLAAGAGRDARMEVARGRLNDMHAAHPELAADRASAQAIAEAHRAEARAKRDAAVAEAGGFGAFMTQRRIESREAVKNIRETGDPNTSLAMKRAEIQAKLGRYANEQLTDEGKAEYGRLRGALRTIESSRLRGRHKNAAYDQLGGQIESSGLDSLIVKPKPPTIEIGGITYRTKYDNAGNVEVGEPLIDPKTTVPKDFDAYVLTPQGDKEWEAMRAQMNEERLAQRMPVPTDAEVRAALKSKWDAKRNATGTTATAGGSTPPQSGTDMMSVAPQQLPPSPTQYVVGTTYMVIDPNTRQPVPGRWNGMSFDTPD